MTKAPDTYPFEQVELKRAAINSNEAIRLVEWEKNLMLIDNPGGTNYYVSTAGDDDNDGLSALTPFRTWAKVRSLCNHKIFTDVVTVNFALGTYNEDIFLENVVCPLFTISGVSHADRMNVVFTKGMLFQFTGGVINLRYCRVIGEPALSTGKNIGFYYCKNAELLSVVMDDVRAFGAYFYSTNAGSLNTVTISNKTSAAVNASFGSTVRVTNTCNGSNNQYNFDPRDFSVIVTTSYAQFGTSLSGSNVTAPRYAGQVVLNTFDLTKLQERSVNDNILYGLKNGSIDPIKNVIKFQFVLGKLQVSYDGGTTWQEVTGQ